MRLIKLMVYVSENSKHHTTKKFVNKNKSWINALQSIMLNGWRTILEEDYINELRVALKLKIKTESRLAYNVFKVINKEIFDKNKDGDIPFLLFDKPYDKVSVLPDINRRSWDNGFMLKLNRTSSLMNKFNNFILHLKKIGNNEKVKRNEIVEIFSNYFDLDNWEHNLDDILYFIEYWYQSIKVNTSKIGNLINIEIYSDKIKKITNFNNNILYYQVKTTKALTLKKLDIAIKMNQIIFNLPLNKYIKFDKFLKIWTNEFDETIPKDIQELLTDKDFDEQFELKYVNKNISEIKRLL